MALKYYAEYKESFFDGHTHRVNIYDNTFSGSATEKKFRVQPTNLKYNIKDETLESPIRASELIINLWEETPGEFEEFFTTDPKRFEVVYLINSVTYWRGFIQPELFEAPYLYQAPISLRATCGLGGLKNETYEPYNLSHGNVKLFNVITRCLSSLVTSTITLYIYDSCYITENNVPQGDNISSLNHIYCTEKIFEDEKDGWMNCYEILEHILKRFHLYIVWHGNGFHVLQINANKDSYYERRYNLSTGAYIGFASVDNSIDISTTQVAESLQNFWLDGSQFLTLYKGWKEFIIKQDYGFIEELLGTRFYNDANRYIDVAGTNNKLKLSSISGGSTVINSIYNQKVIEGFNYSSHQYLNIQLSISEMHNSRGRAIIRIEGASTTYYLNNIGNWVENVPQVSMEFDSVGTASHASDVVPISGDIYIRFEIAPAGLTNRYYVIDIDSSKFYINKSDVGYFVEEENVRELNSNNNKIEDIEVIIGDVPETVNTKLIYKGALYYTPDSEATFTPTSSWTIAGEGDDATLNELVADEYGVNHVKPLKKLEGVLRSHFDILSVVGEGDNKYLIISADYRGWENEWEVVMLQLGYPEGFLRLKGAGFVLLKGGGKIKLKRTAS